MARDHFDLSGKIAVVAGASRGIGAEIAKILGEYGAHVIACSRDAARCGETVEAIAAIGDAPSIVISATSAPSTFMASARATSSMPLPSPTSPMTSWTC